GAGSAPRPGGGRAMFAAVFYLGFQSAKTDKSNVHGGARGEGARPPPLQVHVELKPGETEVIGSNLDSQQTAQLLELARVAFEREALADPKLRKRARESAEQSLRAHFLSLGFRDVVFTDSLTVAGSN